jgi:hypothetical protein
MLCLARFKKEPNIDSPTLEEKNMKTLKKLSAVVVLTSVLGLSAFAGETQTPPCAPPEPGDTQTPPCTGQALGDSSGLVSTPSASDYLVAEAAISLFESLLPLY